MSTPARPWRVWVSDPALADMIRTAAAAHPSETGGVLVGVVLGRGCDAGRPWVTHAVEVRSRKSGPGHYELPAGARERVVKRLRRDDPWLGYLGDWHSHPIDLGPSVIDTRSIASISATGDCVRPLLFVLRRAKDAYAIDGRQWTGASLRRLRVLGTGPLTPIRTREMIRAPKRRRLSSVRSQR